MLAPAEEQQPDADHPQTRKPPRAGEQTVHVRPRVPVEARPGPDVERDRFQPRGGYSGQERVPDFESGRRVGVGFDLDRTKSAHEGHVARENVCPRMNGPRGQCGGVGGRKGGSLWISIMRLNAPGSLWAQSKLKKLSRSSSNDGPTARRNWRRVGICEGLICRKWTVFMDGRRSRPDDNIHSKIRSLWMIPRCMACRLRGGLRCTGVPSSPQNTESNERSSSASKTQIKSTNSTKRLK